MAFNPSKLQFKITSHALKNSTKISNFFCYEVQTETDTKLQD